MANCVNTNTKEFKELSAEAKLNPIVLAAKVSLWQESNGLDNFPTLKDLRIKEFNSVKGFFESDSLSTLSKGTITTSALLDSIKNSAHPLSIVATHLSQYEGLLKNSTSSLVDDETMDKEGALGYYEPSQHSIFIKDSMSFKEGGTVAVHEILHAFSYREIRANTTNAKNFEELYQYAKAFFPEYNAETREGTYGTYTSDEFMVALYTDAKFIKALQQIPALNDTKFKNAYEEIIDYLLSLLGIEKTKDPTLYSQAFFAAETILNDANERLTANREYEKAIADNKEYTPFSKSKLGAITTKGISSLLDTTFQTERYSNTVSFEQGKAIKRYNALQTDHHIEYASKLENTNTGEHSFTYAIVKGKVTKEKAKQQEIANRNADASYKNKQVTTELNLFSTIEEENEGLTEETKTERNLDYYNGDEALYTQEEGPELTNITPEESELIEGKTVEQYLDEQFTVEENKEIEEIQEDITDLYSNVEKLKDYVKSLEEVQKPGAVLGTTEFGGAVRVSFTSVDQAVNYFETKIEELQQEILEEGEALIANGSLPTGLTQPHYDAYLKQKESMLSYVENSLKNLYKQKNQFKSTKFETKIQEFRVLQDNLISDIFDFNKPGVDKLNLIERFFKQDVDTVVSLLKNPTIDNYFLAKDLLDFMQKISDPTKEEKAGNVMTPYLNPKAYYSPEVLKMLENVRTHTDKAQMLVKNAGEIVLIELLERHESKLKSIYKTDSLDEIRQELKKELSDITQVESYLFATGENLVRENNILDSLMRLEYEVEESKAMAIQTAIKTEINIAETRGVKALESIGEDYSLFVKPGKFTDKLIEKFSSSYTSFIKAIKTSVDSKIYEAIKNKDWLLEQQLLTQKFNLLNNDTEFIDIGLLHEIEDGSGNYSKYQLGTSTQAAAYKAQLISKIGQIEYDIVVETQKNNLDAFQQDLKNYVQYKLDQEGKLLETELSPESQKNIVIFEARFNPLKFTENYKLNGGNMVAYSMGTQANTAVAKLTYNTYIPRKVDSQGNSTDYFDTQFDKIANNPDILALYTAIRKGVYHIEDNLRGSGVFVNTGDLPTFKKTITDTLLDKGWLGAMKQGLPTSLPEIKNFLLATVTLAPIRSFLGRQLSGTSQEFGNDNTIVTPTEVSFDNKGDNKTDLSLVVKAALEFSAVHKARAQAKDKVRLYMEESSNIKDALGRDRVNEMARQKFFYDKLLLNKKGKKQYYNVSETLIAWDRKMSGNPFAKSRMFYKYFTSEQKVVYKEALKAWTTLKNKGFSNLTKQEEEDRIALENTMENLGNDYFLSTIYTAVAMKLAIAKNLALNIPAQIFNKINGWTTCVNRDGRYWPKGSVYACSSFLHKKPMMKHVDEAWKKESDILRLFTDRLALINDGTSEIERAEGRLRKKFNVLYPMGLMQWAEDSNQTLSILCMATGFNIKDKQGNEMPLFTGSNFNGYTIKDGNLELLPEFDTPENRETLLSMSSESFLNWKADTKETLQELNGDYSHTGITRIKGNVLTAPFMLYKTWLPRYLGSRWRREQKNIKTGTIERGFMLESIKGKTSGASGFLLGTTSAVGFASAMFPGFPLIVGGGLALAGIGKNIARSRSDKRTVVPDADEFIITWQKQVMFVLQTLLRTPATPINMIAGRELIEGSEKYLGLDETKLNQKTSALAARDVARNLQYSLTVAALSFAVQAAFGPPDEEKEKKGEEGSAQRKRWEAQQERIREEHPYFNFVANALERMLQETNTCLDPTILATTFGSKNTLEGSFDSLAKLFQAINRTEEEDIIKTGKNIGQTKTSKFLRATILPATIRQLGAEGGIDNPFRGWRAGFESMTEEERNTKFYSKDLLRTTDFKKSAATYKAELAVKMPIAQDNVLKAWKYETINDVPIPLITAFKKQVKLEANKIIKTENLDKDLKDKIFVPRRESFDKEQMKKVKGK
jgi:hypothetical protein